MFVYHICKYPLYTFNYTTEIISLSNNFHKGKAVPLQAWGGPEGSRKLTFPDFLTTAQDGGNFVSLSSPVTGLE
jgi:hypothetical protein